VIFPKTRQARQSARRFENPAFFYAQDAAIKAQRCSADHNFSKM
jgi:hypothetical protein